MTFSEKRTVGQPSIEVRLQFVFILLILVAIFAFPFFANAQNYQLLEPTFGGVVGFDGSTKFETLFTNLYQWIFKLAGLVAVLLLIYAGVLYVFGGFGGPTESNISKAKGIFWDLAIGGSILLISYIALRAINTQFVSISFDNAGMPPIWTLVKGGGGGGGLPTTNTREEVTQALSHTPVAPTDPQADPATQRQSQEDRVRASVGEATRNVSYADGVMLTRDDGSVGLSYSSLNETASACASCKFEVIAGTEKYPDANKLEIKYNADLERIVKNEPGVRTEGITGSQDYLITRGQVTTRYAFYPGDRLGNKVTITSSR
ncbi:MAG: hypothetical protein COV10_03885 [Candidatus Vogelbacteria bacterium CG10_big_fil_rev_8_21_14_0_10_51_16]|uniref:Uncharacterized protein n=1 Tax=Candidatus Vogelbacteria bacterium CG10_big_fil_rev_8_21_14_0_10_51_16 TaxID=1975045 RepID=A0A2H0RFN8_9BACT|nr:MAG: hypothetical protein COV10_03885 [Candidatus Vogelbacteria bacterium CG10_big_fil_rev_8_21_14_0_10_51_16]